MWQLGRTMVLALLLVAAAVRADEPLVPERLYNGIHRPLPLRIEPPRAGTLELVLLRASGAELERLPAEAGVHRLDRSMPGIWELQEAAYLQLLVDETPVGSALVIQPMLSRLVPVTEMVEGRLRVVGWRDEAIEGAQEPTDPDAPRLSTGLRVYVERDVLLDTDKGEIVIGLRPDRAPQTAWNFRELAAGGFYRDVEFHRIVPLTEVGDPFVIQSGDPSATGAGGAGYWLPLERSTLEHDFGVISMARDADPDSAGSQFFIGLSREGTAHLNGQYCAFGRIIGADSAETVRAIAAVELADVAAGKPVDAPRIFDALLIEAAPRTPGASTILPTSIPEPAQPRVSR